jgi:hypothetical protein
MTWPELSGSGKRGNPCERMQAEYASPSPALGAFEDPRLAPDEPPHAEASRDSPATPAIASASAARLGCGPRPFAVRALRAKIVISFPFSPHWPACLSPLYDIGGFITVSRLTRPGGLRRSLGALCGSIYCPARQRQTRRKVWAAMVAAVRVSRPQKL